MVSPKTSTRVGRRHVPMRPTTWTTLLLLGPTYVVAIGDASEWDTIASDNVPLRVRQEGEGVLHNQSGQAVCVEDEVGTSGSGIAQNCHDTLWDGLGHARNVREDSRSTGWSEEAE